MKTQLIVVLACLANAGWVHAGAADPVKSRAPLAQIAFYRCRLGP